MGMNEEDHYDHIGQLQNIEENNSFLWDLALTKTMEPSNKLPGTQFGQTLAMDFSASLRCGSSLAPVLVGCSLFNVFCFQLNITWDCLQPNSSSLVVFCLGHLQLAIWDCLFFFKHVSIISRVCHFNVSLLNNEQPA